jgi:hypothetical protein
VTLPSRDSTKIVLINANRTIPRSGDKFVLNVKVTLLNARSAGRFLNPKVGAVRSRRR